MKKSIISKRVFMRGLTTGTISVAMVPSWTIEHGSMHKNTNLTAKSEQAITSLSMCLMKHFFPSWATTCATSSQDDGKSAATRLHYLKNLTLHHEKQKNERKNPL